MTNLYLAMSPKPAFRTVCGPCTDPCALRLRIHAEHRMLMREARTEGRGLMRMGRRGMQLLRKLVRSLAEEMEEVEREQEIEGDKEEEEF